MSTTLAFLGVGLMGAPMIENLAKAGNIVHIWNRTEAKAQHLAQLYPQHVVAHASAKSAIEQAKTFVIVMLFGYDSIQQSIPSDADLSGKIILCGSTISVAESTKLHQRFTIEHNATYVECPVLGTNTVAKAGKLNIMLGCERPQYEQIASSGVLDPLGTLFHVGVAPKALKLKLCFNFMVVSLTGLFANAVALVQREELDVDMFMEIMRNSAFYFKYMDVKLGRMLNHNYDDPNFSVTGILKDMKAVEQEIQHNHVYDGLIKAFITMIQETIDQSPTNGVEDFAAMFEVMKKKQ